MADDAGAPRRIRARSGREARSIIMLGMSYAPDGDPLEALASPPAARFRSTPKARDYHDIIKGKLKQLAGALRARRPARRSRCSSTPRR